MMSKSVKYRPVVTKTDVVIKNRFIFFDIFVTLMISIQKRNEKMSGMNDDDASKHLIYFE